MFNSLHLYTQFVCMGAFKTHSIMGKFIECVLLMVAGACAGALAIMLAVMTLPTVLDTLIQYIMVAMFAAASVIALLQFAKQWNSLFK